MPTHRAAVVVNPSKVDEGTSVRDDVTAALAEAGWEPPLWLETSLEDPGYAAAQEALDQGVDLVLALGGDGTVRAVLTVLAGTKVPLAVVPFGTGNLLARNLDLPLNDLAEAVDIAVNGADRVIDVGRIEPTDSKGRHERFAVMAGVGMDAAIMRDAPEAVKARVGWPAYVLSALKHLRRQGVQMQITIDGGRPYHTRAQTVVVGNLGRLQGGVRLLLDAVPDDGLLDVAVVSSRGLADLGRILSRIVTHRAHTDRRFITVQGRHIEVVLRRPQPRQVDGDLLDPSPLLAIEIEPAAVVVRVRRPPAAPCSTLRAQQRPRRPRKRMVMQAHRSTLSRLVVGGIGVYALLAATGLLLTRAFAHSALISADQRVSQWFFEHRTPALNTWTHVGSLLADTVTAIAVSTVLVVGLRLGRKRWRESSTVLVSIVGELFIFVLVTATVHRQRPTVPHLDPAPPTSSFPSGHTGAAMALYVAFAVILLRLTRGAVHRAAAVASATVLCIVPLVVAVSRIYRGMHFLTDVMAGAVAGGLWMAVVVTTLLPSGMPSGAPGREIVHT